MPPPRMSSEFIQLLELSGLVDKSVIASVLEKAGEVADWPAPKVAELFVNEKTISRFQADQLLAGRHRGFFIGKYKIQDLIGSGGMGRVYLAEHAIMRRQVALKVLPKGKSSDPSALGRFQREARAVAALRHPNIIQAYDIDHEGDIHFIVMEYVDGISVQEYVRRHGPMRPDVAADVIAQACDALEHANAAGLVHRDIKPGNLLVDKTGIVKLLDMGLAVFFEEKERDPLTLEYDENVLGTADYLAPEQALDSHNVDIRADIYSLGGTFYYMLTGQAPFPEGTIAQKLLWHQNRHPRSIREIQPEVPATIEKIVRKMMAKDPKNRFQTPREVRDILASFSKRQVELFENESEVNRPPTSQPGAPRTKVPSDSVRISKTAAETSVGPEKSREKRRRKPVPETEVLPVIEGISPFDDASVLTAAPSTDSSVIGDSADFLQNLAETAATSSSSRVTPKSSPSQSAIAIVKEQLNDPRKKRVAMLVLGSVAIVGVLALGSALFFFSSDSPVPKPPVATAQPISAPASDPNTLVVSRNPSGRELLLDEALYEVKRGQKIQLMTDGPTTWEISNLRIESGSIAAEEVSLIGSGSDTVLSLPKSHEGAVVSIRDTPGFVLSDLVLDGGGKPGPVLEIVGPRAAGVVIRNVTIRNFKGEGIRLTNVQAKANQPVLLEKVLVVGSDRENIGIAIAPPSATGSPGRSYYVQVTTAKIDGPFAFGLKIAQPVNSLVLDDCTFTKGTAGIGLFAKEMDWSKVSLNQPRFEMLERAVQSEIGDEAIAKLQWKAPIFKEVKIQPALAETQDGAKTKNVALPTDSP